MITETQTVTLRKLTASEGQIITDIATERMRAKVVWLGKDDCFENYKEIAENTPLPEIVESEEII